MAYHKNVLIDKEVLINIVSNAETSRSIQPTLQLETLHLLMEFHIQSASGAPKELLVQLTDEADPLLLLSANISETSYQNLRSSQGLLVDFDSFPHHFSDLIKNCIEEQQMESPKFVLVLRVSGKDVPSLNKSGLTSLIRTSGAEIPGTHGPKFSIELEIVERNLFKELCHLSISLVPASLENKLLYLSSTVKDLKSSLTSQLEKSRGESLFMAQEIQRLKEALQQKTQEVNTMRADMHLKLNAEVEKRNVLLNQEKEVHLKRKSDFDRRLDREKRELEEKLSKQIEKLRLENSSLKKTNSEKCAAVGKLEVSLRDHKARLENMEEEFQRQSEQINELRLEKASLTKNSRNLQDTVRKLEQQIISQEGYIQEYEKRLVQTERQSEDLKQENAVLQGNLQESLAKLQKRENTIQVMFKDFHKSLDVIKQLRAREKVLENEKASYFERIKSKEVVMMEREKEVRKYKEEHEADLVKLAKSEADLKEAREKLKEALEKIHQQENSLRNNENVIARFNKQLNEMESLEAIVRKAPLAEAYLHPQQNIAQGRIEESTVLNTGTDFHTTSTPSSAAVPKFGMSLRSKMNSMNINDHINDIPPIPEEAAYGNSEIPHNKENVIGLDPLYLEPTAKSLPVRGILRANAITSRRGRGTTRLRGQKKVIGKEPSSSYFPKKS